MRIYALILLCFTVALLSGLTLFLSLSRQPDELWLDVLFLTALMLTLVLSLTLIKQSAGESMMSLISSARDRNPGFDRSGSDHDDSLSSR